MNSFVAVGAEVFWSLASDLSPAAAIRGKQFFCVEFKRVKRSW